MQFAGIVGCANLKGPFAILLDTGRDDAGEGGDGVLTHFVRSLVRAHMHHRHQLCSLLPTFHHEGRGLSAGDHHGLRIKKVLKENGKVIPGRQEPLHQLQARGLLGFSRFLLLF